MREYDHASATFVVGGRDLEEIRRYARANGLGFDAYEEDLRRLREELDACSPALAPPPPPPRRQARARHQQRAPMVRQRSWLVEGRGR
jgi:hypothetical protein